MDLRTLPLRTGEDRVLAVHSFSVPRHHPSILFGDGGALKSYWGLYFLGQISERDIPVALFDWELDGEDHRERLGRLFPDGMPRILYCRCDRPLVYEVDRLRRIVRDNGVQYAMYDSVAFACDGPPEAAEVAGRYLRAARQIGCGGLHVAHVSKAEGADQKPFGSAFWHNGARCTWFAQQAESSKSSDVQTVGLFNRKVNLDRLLPPAGFTAKFEEHTTLIRPTDVAGNPDLAGQLSIRQRMAALLGKQALTPAEIAEEIEAKPDTVERTARRYKDQFVIIPGGRIGLLAPGGRRAWNTGGHFFGSVRKSLQVTDSTRRTLCKRTVAVLGVRISTGQPLQVTENIICGHFGHCPLWTVRRQERTLSPLFRGGMSACPPVRGRGKTQREETMNEFNRIVEAYLRMARWYRPGAPGDGLGTVTLKPAEVQDRERLVTEGGEYARAFIAEEDTARYFIGVSNYATNRALVYAIEAARLLCSGMNDGLAERLLRMALEETRREGQRAA